MTGRRQIAARRPIALIGCRGSGKTTVARAIASLSGGNVADTDDLIVARTGRVIADIFAREGESAFRRYEADALFGLLESLPSVISVGGGAVLRADNVRRLRETCFVVWLTAPAEVLWERIERDESTASSRPPLTGEAGLAEVRSVLDARQSLYHSAAHVTIDTNRRTPPDIAREILTLSKASGML